MEVAGLVFGIIGAADVCIRYDNILPSSRKSVSE